MNIEGGRFSYAEIPHEYDCIFGVSGTLQSMGAFEKSVIEDEYGIKHQLIMPSVYGRRDANFHVSAAKHNN